MFLSFPPGTEMFQFPGFAHLIGVIGLQPIGLPHSDMLGSIPACSSPSLFAACHVLRRLRKPRHPPFALCNFFLNESCYRSFELSFAYEIVVPNIFLYYRLSSLFASLFNLVNLSQYCQ